MEAFLSKLAMNLRNTIWSLSKPLSLPTIRPNRWERCAKKRWYPCSCWYERGHREFPHREKMTRTTIQQNLLTKVTIYLSRLSIRRKITIAILLSFILIFPTALLSLHYQSSILQEINIIIEQDVALGRYASDISMIMLDIRRNARN